MFIAMNRFRITPGRESDFEQIWRSRESYLEDVAGFREFHLLTRAVGREAHVVRITLGLGVPERVRGLDPIRGLPEGTQSGPGARGYLPGATGV
jgi:hypothetical protein